MLSRRPVVGNGPDAGCGQLPLLLRIFAAGSDGRTPDRGAVVRKRSGFPESRADSLDAELFLQGGDVALGLDLVLRELDLALGVEDHGGADDALGDLARTSFSPHAP